MSGSLSQGAGGHPILLGDAVAGDEAGKEELEDVVGLDYSLGKDRLGPQAAWLLVVKVR